MTTSSQSPSLAERRTFGIEASWATVAAWLGLSASVGMVALRHVSQEHFALLWDDALFFKRVAYNMLHHGFAGWNQGDGPLFVNTSQLFQLLAAGVLGLFPDHYNAAMTFWGALAVSLCLPLLVSATRAGPLGALLAFCLLQAPPVHLSITTGMETPTVFLVLSAFVFVLLGRGARRGVADLVLLQVCVYTVRPDAILLSGTAAFLLLAARRQIAAALRFGVYTALALAAVSLAFYAYYGAVVPLSTFLKVSPISIYDSDYLSMDLTNKLKNLAQVGLVLLPILPLAVWRRDRENLALGAAALVFIAFHAFTTYEIAAYHARFYAPALPFAFAAALRGVSAVDRPSRCAILVALGAAAGGVVAVTFPRNWIESSKGYGPDVVSAFDYARCLAGAPLLGMLVYGASRWQRWRARRGGAQLATPSVALGSAALVAVLTAAGVSHALTPSWTIVSDEVSNAKTIFSHAAAVNMEIIDRCFEEPFQLTHSEIGLPGVMFLESKVIDFTGLANPSIIDQTFDFELLCTRDKPEFVYRPHPTHRALNRTLDGSACLAQNYVRVRLPRRSSCPLYVRRDLLDQYLKCSR